MTRRNPNYTDEFRASAVLMLEAAGYPDKVGALNRVANHLGIPRQTLQRWARGTRNPPPPEMVTSKRLEFVDLLNEIMYGAAEEIKQRIDHKELDGVTLPQLMTVAAIAVDKKQLLSGQPTAINEDRVSDARERLARGLDSRAAARGQDGPANRPN